MDHAKTVLQRFVSLQRKLIATFITLHRPQDTEYFKDIPDGSMDVDGTRWVHSRHGSGIRFVGEDGTVVDVHTALATQPTAITAWRLAQYLESRGTNALAYADKSFSLDDEASVELMLRSLQEHHVLRATGARTYVLLDSSETPTESTPGTGSR